MKNIIRKISIFTLFAPLFLCLSVSLGSCRHPDGYIGHYLGNWSIEKIEVDSTPLEGYRGDIMISFQGNIFLLAYIDGKETYGTWEEDGTTFSLRADYNAGAAQEMPSELGFGSNRRINMEIMEDKRKSMIWRYTADDGKVYTYYLRKIL